MGTPGLHGNHVRRRKLISGLVGGALAVTALVVVIAYFASKNGQGPSGPILESPPANVHQQASGYTFTRSDGGQRVFTVRAARTVAFRKGGTTVLEDVTVEVFGRAGNRHDIIRTQRCDYNPQSGDLYSSGPVDIELNAPPDGELSGAASPDRHPVHLETSKLSFQHEGSLALTDQPVKFSFGAASGTARGMVYATQANWLELKNDVSLELREPAGSTSQIPVHLTASRLRYDKTTSDVELWGPVDISQGGRHASGDHGMVLLDEHDQVRRVDLENNVKGFDRSGGRDIRLAAQHVWGEFDPAAGELRRIVAETDVQGEVKSDRGAGHLTAQHLELSLTGKHEHPEKGLASGDVHLAFQSWPMLKPGASPAPQAGTETKDLTASEVNFNFRPGGSSLRDATTAGPGTLVITPADPKVGKRVVTAGQLLMAFDAEGHLETMQGRAPTKIVFHPPANATGAVAQVSTADHLDALFDPATQILREVRQSGNFRFQDADRQASAQDARYVARTDQLFLTGDPEVWDPNSRMKCEHLTFELRTDTAVGEGRVQATHLRKPADGGTAVPTNVLADRVIAERKSQVVHYEGHVRAWHGADVVESSSLDVYRAEKRVSSGSKVVTSHLQPASLVSGPGEGTKASGADTRPVTIRADELEYFDQGRTARYRGHVQFQTENTTLDSDRLDVYFSEGGSVEQSEVERAVADGHVVVTQPGRRATGEHAEYYAGPGKIVLTGGPPTLYDEEKGFTTGQRLTFFIHDDRLIVDGGEHTPSISKHRVAQ